MTSTIRQFDHSNILIIVSHSIIDCIVTNDLTALTAHHSHSLDGVTILMFMIQVNLRIVLIRRAFDYSTFRPSTEVDMTGSTIQFYYFTDLRRRNSLLVRLRDSVDNIFYQLVYMIVAREAARQYRYDITYYISLYT